MAITTSKLVPGVCVSRRSTYALVFLYALDLCADMGFYSCYGNNCNSTWSRWGRWVLLACIIAVFFVLFFLFS
jgi:hypothetical protein